MTHDDALLAAEEHLRQGYELLKRSADILRGPEIRPEPRLMRMEIALTRAIESLFAIDMGKP